MSNSYELEGIVEINGVIENNKISVFFSYDNSVVITGIGKQGLLKKKLYLRPFDAFMLRNSQSEVMKSGFFYSISGTNVGSYSYGPLGHPGDGEFDFRPITKFDIRCRYTADDLTVEIEGITEKGTSGFRQYQDKPLSPWKYRVNFKVPRITMKQFFNFTDHNFPFFEKLLDACH